MALKSDRILFRVRYKSYLLLRPGQPLLDVDGQFPGRHPFAYVGHGAQLGRTRRATEKQRNGLILESLKGAAASDNPLYSRDEGSPTVRRRGVGPGNRRRALIDEV